MPAQRLAMRQVHEVVCLQWGQGLSERQIAQSLGISRPTVAETAGRHPVPAVAGGQGSPPRRLAVQLVLYNLK